MTRLASQFLLLVQVSDVRRHPLAYLAISSVAAILVFSISVGLSALLIGREHLDILGRDNVILLLREGAATESESSLSQGVIDEVRSAVPKFGSGCAIHPELVVVSVDNAGNFAVMRGLYESPRRADRTSSSGGSLRITLGNGTAYLGVGVLPDGSPAPRFYELAGVRWRVTGTYSTGGAMLDTEALVDAPSLSYRYHLQSPANSIRLICTKLDRRALVNGLSELTQARLTQQTEKHYFKTQSGDIKRLQLVLAGVCGTMLLLSCLAGLCSVSWLSRERHASEQMTLTAIGFSKNAVSFVGLVRDIIVTSAGMIAGVICAALALPNLQFAISVGGDRIRFTGELRIVAAVVALTLAYICVASSSLLVRRSRTTIR